MLILKDRTKLPESENSEFILLKNCEIYLKNNSPFVIYENNIICDIIYKFSCCSNDNQHTFNKNALIKEIDKAYYLPVEDNYYHSMIYGVLHLPYLKEYPIITNNSKTLSHFISLFKNTIINDTGICYKVKELLILKNPGPYKFDNVFNKNSLKMFLDSLEFPNESVRIHKLYIKRSGERSISNDKEFEKYLGENGFQIIILEKINIDQQIKLFQKAKVIIGVHGAGLTNIMFCDKECHIIELKHKLMEQFKIHNCYKQIAESKMLNNFHQYYSNHVKPKKSIKAKNYDMNIDIPLFQLTFNSVILS